MKGWERASIRFHTRPDRVPAFTTPTDFLVPTGRITFGLISRCGVIAFCCTLFYVLLPLAMFGAWTHLPSLGEWLWVVGAAGFVACWLGTVWAAVREEASIRDWLADQ
jgi:hypothetical protein